MDLGLKDKVVIVAASSQGLGRAAAERFAAEGARLAICSRDDKKIRSVADDLHTRFKTDVVAEALDVADPASVERFCRGVAERFGRIDVCVTNAGGPPSKDFLSITMDDWRRAVDMNFLSVVAFAREVIPQMQRNRWGRFITITSVAVKQPVPELIMSNAVRSAVVGLIKSLANQYGRDGILFHNVGPGYTDTERVKQLAAVKAKAGGVSEDEVKRQWASGSAVGRIGRPEEIADVIVWLASERASYLTGQTVLVDGGSYKGV
jgi:3-oxoacyl-[acyl-carrier protein] reductase